MTDPNVPRVADHFRQPAPAFEGDEIGECMDLVLKLPVPPEGYLWSFSESTITGDVQVMRLYLDRI